MCCFQYVTLRTRYSELMTLTSQYIRFITETQRRLEDEEVTTLIKSLCSTKTHLSFLPVNQLVYGKSFVITFLKWHRKKERKERKY